jgi:phosphatidylglycerophosphate synthase
MNSFSCGIITISGLIMLSNGNYYYAVILMLAAFVFFIKEHKNAWGKLPFFGAANLITTARLLLVLALASGEILFSDYGFFIVVLIIPLLDVVDGLVARRRKEESQFGMYYDMEVDALFVMVASIIIYLNHSSMWIVLIPAFLRYFFKFLLSILDKQKKFIESKQKYASIIAGNYFVALVLFSFMNNDLTKWYLSLSSIMIMMSFAKSIINIVQWKRTDGISR